MLPCLLFNGIFVWVTPPWPSSSLTFLHYYVPSPECEACHLRKHHCNPFSSSSHNHQFESFDVFHIDRCIGPPSRISTLNSFLFFSYLCGRLFSNDVVLLWKRHLNFLVFFPHSIMKYIFNLLYTLRFFNLIMHQSICSLLCIPFVLIMVLFTKLFFLTPLNKWCG